MSVEKLFARNIPVTIDAWYAFITFYIKMDILLERLVSVTTIRRGESTRKDR